MPAAKRALDQTALHRDLADVAHQDCAGRKNTNSRDLDAAAGDRAAEEKRRCGTHHNNAGAKGRPADHIAADPHRSGGGTDSDLHAGCAVLIRAGAAAQIAADGEAAIGAFHGEAVRAVDQDFRRVWAGATVHVVTDFHGSRVADDVKRAAVVPAASIEIAPD